ncbi:GNAT family N-acetyltransferase [Lysobacter sp. CA199]|uniref:GNAT family N-acetyltransferase n=1 Tax=Lysobacter sp. CA199 TaxID=3455608 RepID=UPI003F8D52BE
MHLRNYSPADREACLALFTSNVPEYFAQIERADFIHTLENIEDYWVLELEDEGVVACGGYAAARPDPESGPDSNAGVAVLCWGMVRRDLHRRGLGERLLSERLNRIDADPAFHSVRIETTTFSRDFFARHGFVVTREQADGFAPGYDLVEMRRPVPWPQGAGGE